MLVMEQFGSETTISKQNKQANKYTDNMCSHKLGKKTTPTLRHATPIVKTSVFISIIFYLVVVFVVNIIIYVFVC